MDIEELEAQNMRIKSTSLGYKDHGILMFRIELAGAGCGQFWGGIALDGKPVERKPGAKRQPHPFAGACIQQILQVVGVDSWESLPGCYVRVLRENSYGAIEGIQNILDDNLTFFPEEYYAKHYGADD